SGEDNMCHSAGTIGGGEGNK
uniref:Uncharacterized protein n=1 Tax=Solanum lycopersicum TaxID=4081 RepID=A0A3Q7H1M8_SOLLC